MWDMHDGWGWWMPFGRRSSVLTILEERFALNLQGAGAEAAIQRWPLRDRKMTGGSAVAKDASPSSHVILSAKSAWLRR